MKKIILILCFLALTVVSANAIDVTDMANGTASGGIASAARLQNGEVGYFVYFAIGISVLVVLATAVLAIVGMNKKRE